MINSELKVWLALSMSAGILAVSMAGMLAIGAAPIPVQEIVVILGQKMLTADIGAQNVHSHIIWDIRWPRVAMALLAGSSLAVSGACYQAMFKNPLADPFILGVSSGAALGAATAIVLKHTAYISLYAFIGGITAIVAVYLLGGVKARGLNTNQLLLAGIALGSLLNALLSSLMALNSQQAGTILFWLLGSLANPPASLTTVAVLVMLGLIVVMLYTRDLDIISLGDENAQYLGVDVSNVKIILLLCTTLITSTVVAVSGVIGFIGLIVPHMLRRIVGPEHGLLIPMCALWGATFLLWADGITRLVSFAQLPVGVVTAMLGSPFFLYILYTRGY